MGESYDKVLEQYHELEPPIHRYFSSIPYFADELYRNKHILNMVIFYLFMRVERAQSRMVQSVLIERFNLEKDVVKKEVPFLYLTRPQFVKLYEILANTPLDDKIIALGEDAQKIRNKIVHGDYPDVEPKEKEDICSFIFKYADLLNKQAKHDFLFEPFGKERDFNETDDVMSKTQSKKEIKKIKKKLEDAA